MFDSDFKSRLCYASPTIYNCKSHVMTFFYNTVTSYQTPYPLASIKVNKMKRNTKKISKYLKAAFDWDHLTFCQFLVASDVIGNPNLPIKQTLVEYLVWSE